MIFIPLAWKAVGDYAIANTLGCVCGVGCVWGVCVYAPSGGDLGVFERGGAQIKDWQKFGTCGARDVLEGEINPLELGVEFQS